MPVGEAAPMLDAAARVTGRVPYTANLTLPGMLWGKALRSPLPRARIVHLDLSHAARAPGVVATLSAADLAAPDASLYYGAEGDQPVVARGQVNYVGEPVAAIAAETAEAAEEALRLVEVEYQELPPVYDPLEALAPGAPLVNEIFPGNLLAHARLRHGDVEVAFRDADEIIEETFASPVAQPAPLETQVTVAQWEDGRLTVWTASQSPYTVRRELARIFGLPPEAVRVIVPPLGGGFGAKGNVRTQPLTAALAWRAHGRPVKLMLSRSEDFVSVTKHAAVLRFKTGVKRDGALTGREITIHWNAGAYASSSTHLVPAGMLRAIGPYRLPAVRVDSFGVATNLPPAAAFRGAMSSQGAWGHEAHMDTIAHRLGIDPLELRLKNLLRAGDTFATGETIHEAYFVECLQAAADSLGWGQPFDRQPAPTVRRGRGLGVMMKNTLAASRSECRLALDENGLVTLFTSAVEMGQGAHTMLAQMCAEALGLPLAAINVRGPDTDLTPYDAQTASSRTAFMMGNAVVDGAAALVAKLRALAAEILARPVDDVAVGPGTVFCRRQPERRLAWADVVRRAEAGPLEANGCFQTEGGLDPETGQGVASPHWHQGAGACEVEVDIETGRVVVLRYHATAFAGRVINPQLARLQNDGNVIFGLGPALMEEVIFDGGQIVNANLADYLIPSISDIPGELRSTCLEAGSSIHGLGEMTLPPVAPAIANAVHDAVGVRIRDLPLSAERVYRAMRQAA